MPPSVRIIVVRGVVGDWVLTPAAYVDRVDLFVGSGSGVVGVGYPLALRRVGRKVVGCTVVGDWELVPTVGLMVKISKSFPSLPAEAILPGLPG